MVIISCLHGGSPRLSRHATVQRGKAIRRTIEHVELVGKLVHHHVVAIVGCTAGGHIAPGEHHRSPLPRLTGMNVAHPMDDTGLIEVFVLRDELARIEDQRRALVVVVETEFEDRQTGLRGYAVEHLPLRHEVTTTDSGTAVEKGNGKTPQTLALLRIETVEQWQTTDQRMPAPWREPGTPLAAREAPVGETPPPMAQHRGRGPKRWSMAVFLIMIEAFTRE